MSEEMTAREFLILIQKTCATHRGKNHIFGGTCKSCEALNICPQSQFAKDLDVDRVLSFADRLKQKAASTTNADDLGV